MKPSSHSALAGDTARRMFLKSLATLAGGVALAPSLAMSAPGTNIPARHANRFNLAIEGTGDFRHVVGYQWPAIFDQLPPGMKFRVRYQFPVANRDVLSFLIFVAPDPDDAFVGQPVPADFLISGGSIAIEEITIGAPIDHPVYGSKPTLSMQGQFIANEIPSPFGPIVGRKCALTAAFDGRGSDVNLYLVGVTCAGSHATFIHEARGSLFYQAY